MSGTRRRSSRLTRDKFHSSPGGFGNLRLPVSPTTTRLRGVTANSNSRLPLRDPGLADIAFGRESDGQITGSKTDCDSGTSTHNATSSSVLSGRQPLPPLTFVIDLPELFVENNMLSQVEKSLGLNGLPLRAVNHVKYVLQQLGFKSAGGASAWKLEVPLSEVTDQEGPVVGMPYCEVSHRPFDTVAPRELLLSELLNLDSLCLFEATVTQVHQGQNLAGTKRAHKKSKSKPGRPSSEVSFSSASGASASHIGPLHRAYQHWQKKRSLQTSYSTGYSSDREASETDSSGQSLVQNLIERQLKLSGRMPVLVNKDHSVTQFFTFLYELLTSGPSVHFRVQVQLGPEQQVPGVQLDSLSDLGQRAPSFHTVQGLDDGETGLLLLKDNPLGLAQRDLQPELGSLSASSGEDSETETIALVSNGPSAAAVAEDEEGDPIREAISLENIARHNKAHSADFDFVLDRLLARSDRNHATSLQPSSNKLNLGQQNLENKAPASSNLRLDQTNGDNPDNLSLTHCVIHEIADSLNFAVCKVRAAFSSLGCNYRRQTSRKSTPPSTVDNNSEFLANLGPTSSAPKSDSESA